MIHRHQPSTVTFDPVEAKAWRDKQRDMQISVNALIIVVDEITILHDLCADLSWITAICTVFLFAKVALATTINSVQLALDLSVWNYDETVTPVNEEAGEEQYTAVYENLFVINENIVTSHGDIEKILIMLNGIRSNTGVTRRRMEVIACTNTTDGYLDNCNKPSCENPTRLCDGSLNYDYISQLKGGETCDNTKGCCIFKQV